MANSKCNFTFCHDPEWKVSQPKFGSRPTICDPLVYCIERWATMIVQREAITVLNWSSHAGGPLTAGALRLVRHGSHS